MTTITKEKWTDIRPLLFVPALLVSAYLSLVPGFGFWFIGAKSFGDLAFGAHALAVFLVILAIWWSIGPTLLLIAGTGFFFYVAMHSFGNTYGGLRKIGMNPGLLISVNVLMIIVVIGDVLAGRVKPRWHYQKKTDAIDRR
jgi:hypothetical protein